MKLVKEHREELWHTKALDNALKRSVRGSGTKAWVHKAEKPPDTKNHALLYQVRWSIHALELKCVVLNKKMIHINNRWSSTHSIQPLRSKTSITL